MSTRPGEAEVPPGTLIYRGAEADITLGEWQGLEAVFKSRKPLPYRLPALDDSIRRQRTVREAEIMAQSKRAGVRVPFLYAMDLPRATLVMEYVRGDRLRDLVGSLGTDEAEDTFEGFGRSAARMHMAGIMHGDLTTANVLKTGRDLVFIDFGLSARTNRLEDHAVDLRLIKETLIGAHPGVAQAALDSLFRGYASEVGSQRFRSVLRQLRSIERRGRYARVV
ncbi:MAG: Kae1-associated serine/threonine protein kinase [Nitrososphaerota archaeon]|nr:Kae1-associated serine/threonine protein kinase [Nitrososphaerota archaeon]